MMINMLERLQHDAKECRNLAENSITAEGRDALQDMARDYECRAAMLAAKGGEARALPWRR